MNINNNSNNSNISPIRNQNKEYNIKTEGIISKKELAALAKEGKPSKNVSNKDADPTVALIKGDSKIGNKSIKKAFISFFDTSLPDSRKVDNKTKLTNNEKLIHEKQIKAFFKEFNPERTIEGGKVINEPEYIKKTLDKMLSIIDEASRLPKAERQACLAKFMDLVHSDEFSANLGPVTMENMLTSASAYRDKVIK